MTRVALCADSESLRHPEIIGLEGVSLDSQSWLAAFSCGRDIRDYIGKASCVEEAWAVSADDMEAINVAAALRQDRPDMPIYLVVFSLSGSTLSRARAAGVTGVLSKQAFVHRFAQEKKRRALLSEARGGNGVDTSAATMPGDAEALPADHVAVDSSSAAFGHATAATAEQVASAVKPADTVASGGFTAATPGASGDVGPVVSAVASSAPMAVSEVARAASAVSGGSVSSSNVDVAASGKREASSAPAAASSAGFAAAVLVPEKLAQASSAAASGARAQDGRGASQVMRPPQSASGAFVFTVASGSGGVGKSTVSVVSACLAARRGFRTLLLDCDLQFGDAHALLGKKKAVAVEDVVDSEEALDSVTAPDGKPALICAPRRLELAEVLVEKLPALIDALAARFDVIVVNTGCCWGEQHAMLLERSASTLFVVDQRATSVRTCLHALDLCKRCGIATSSFTFALNRCERGALFSPVDISCALQGARVLELREGGSVVEELLGAGMAFDLVDQGNAFCESVDALLDDILPLRERGHSGRGGARSGNSSRRGRSASSGKRSRRGSRRAERQHGGDEPADADHIALAEEGSFLDVPARPFFQFGSWAFRGGRAYA